MGSKPFTTPSSGQQKWPRREPPPPHLRIQRTCVSIGIALPTAPPPITALRKARMRCRVYASAGTRVKRACGAAKSADALVARPTVSEPGGATKAGAVADPSAVGGSAAGAGAGAAGTAGAACEAALLARGGAIAGAAAWTEAPPDFDRDAAVRRSTHFPETPSVGFEARRRSCTARACSITVAARLLELRRSAKRA